MLQAKRWVLSAPSPDVVVELSRGLDISPITARILASRLEEPTVEAGEAFLRPSLGQLLSPWDMRGMREAARRLARAVREKERIVVYGDYDSDGVTACAALLRVFEALNNPARHYLPSRMEEGYGISDAFVRQALEEEIDVVVTVDCGTHEQERIAALMAGGVDVIVTDHHEPGDVSLPTATAVVNPKRADSSYPFRELTGVGVAFKLAWAVCEETVGSPRVGPTLREALLSLLPIVAIGTIADVAPLVSENRVCVTHGLAGMPGSPAGLQALLEVSGLDAASITPRDIAFRLSPRLNAAGRMGEAELALQLLVEDDPAKAQTFARELDQQNTSRQELCRRLTAEAIAMVHELHDLERDAAIVVAREGWHEGVIGIVASRLAEEFDRPAAVIAFAPGEARGRGSARGVQGLNLYEALSHSRERFLSFGGHEQAAGFTITREAVEPFRSEFRGLCRQQVVEKHIEPQLLIDAEAGLRELTGDLSREVALLEPFGCGNPEPLFLTRRIRVAGRPRLLGETGRHFAFHASQEGVAYRAVVFDHPEWLEAIDRGATREWDIVASPRLSTYFTPPRLELRIIDMRPAGESG